MKTLIEDLNLSEGARVDSERWTGSTGKRVPSGDGMWAFTIDQRKYTDLDDKEHVFQANGKYADAKKQALDWAKKNHPGSSIVIYLLP